jgi:phosphotriesterase-related protein
MPNDGGRMAQILRLIEDGHARQVLMSHDIAYKHLLTKWGGGGYHHLLVNVVRGCGAGAGRPRDPRPAG